jgi:Zn-dependent protease with chaperone function
MSQIDGKYFDGRSARGVTAQVQLMESPFLELSEEGRTKSFGLGDVSISSRIGNTPRHISFPGGGKFETGNNAAIDLFLAQHKQAPGSRMAHWLESRWQAVFIATAITGMFVYGMINYGAPSMAKYVAFSLPNSVETTLGKKGIEALDKLNITKPSKLAEIEKKRVEKLFAGIRQQLQGVDKSSYQIHFRQSKRLGPQALAFPSGIVLVTDDIVNLLQEEKELMAVLAHEIGHGVHRHGLRRLIQNSAVALFFDQLLGDATSLAALAAGLPVFLVEMKYSREFEIEADQFASEFMAQAGLSPKWLGSALERLVADRKHPNIPNFLSSHPGIEERVMAVGASAK